VPRGQGAVRTGAGGSDQRGCREGRVAECKRGHREHPAPTSHLSPTFSTHALLFNIRALHFHLGPSIQHLAPAYSHSGPAPHLGPAERGCVGVISASAFCHLLPRSGPATAAAGERATGGSRRINVQLLSFLRLVGVQPAGWGSAAGGDIGIEEKHSRVGSFVSKRENWLLWPQRAKGSLPTCAASGPHCPHHSLRKRGSIPL